LMLNAQFNFKPSLLQLSNTTTYSSILKALFLTKGAFLTFHLLFFIFKHYKIGTMSYARSCGMSSTYASSFFEIESLVPLYEHKGVLLLLIGFILLLALLAVSSLCLKQCAIRQ